METADILLSPVSRAVFFGYGICDSRSGGDAGDSADRALYHDDGRASAG